LFDVVEIFFLIRGVDAEKHIAIGEAMDEDIVNSAAVFVQQRGIVGLPRFEFGGVVGGDVVDKVEGLRAADFDFAHVAHVEQADGGADGVVFFDDAGVLDGHVPAAKIDHFGFRGEVGFEERSALQVSGVGHSA
jgi:hypothetical protein